MNQEVEQQPSRARAFCLNQYDAYLTEIGITEAVQSKVREVSYAGSKRQGRFRTCTISKPTEDTYQIGLYDGGHGLLSRVYVRGDLASANAADDFDLNTALDIAEAICSSSYTCQVVLFSDHTTQLSESSATTA